MAEIDSMDGKEGGPKKIALKYNSVVKRDK